MRWLDHNDTFCCNRVLAFVTTKLAATNVVTFHVIKVAKCNSLLQLVANQTVEMPFLLQMLQHEMHFKQTKQPLTVVIYGV